MIEFEVDGEKFTVDEEELIKTGDDLQKELFKIPADFLQIGMYLSKVNRLKSDLKLQYEAEYGRTYNEYKAGTYEALYFKKATEEGLVQALNEVDSLNDIKKQINNVSKISDQLYALKSALQMKYDSVIEVCRHIRQEKKNLE